MPDNCQKDTHCFKDNSKGTDYINYTTHLLSYTDVSNDEGGGAIRVRNGRFSSRNCNFTSCTSNDGGVITIYNNIPNAQSSYSI